MKRSNLVCFIFCLGVLSFSSCTKHLKDDLRRLQQQYDDLSHGLGSDEPITATTTFKDKKGNAISITDTYRFKSANYQTQYMIKQADGTYYIYFERFVDVQWNEGLAMSFIYNPATKEISRQQVFHYWDDNAEYNSFVQYNVAQYSDGLKFDLNLRELDVSTGNISLDVKIEGTEVYTKTAPSYYVPVVGSPVSTSFSFTGKLGIF
ncbi:MAG: hypothetical protein J7578_22285 [Chitinophagaceae bacterium]|nr:hypothetical protein [Chitinophagaceae bacterium]